MKTEKTICDGVYFWYKGPRKILLTKNLTPGVKFFGEKEIEGHREFNASRSKLAAAILKNINFIPLKRGNTVLYLGAAQGQTASHVSDIVGKEGFVFALDFAPRVVRELVFVCEKRDNMAPILADANQPETYKDRVTKVDVIYQDISQRNQVNILIKNAEMFLKKGGFAMIAIKARSIDVTKNPKEVFANVKMELEKKFRIIDYKILEPFQKAHCFFVCRY